MVFVISDTVTGLAVSGLEIVQALIYSLPPLMGLLIPVSMFFATLLGVGRLAADRELMPPYPGIEGSDSCLDWELDLPLDMSRVREKDEAWWDEHGGTPKAFAIALFESPITANGIS